MWWHDDINILGIKRNSLDELLGCVLLKVLLQVLDALECNVGVEDQVVAAAQCTLVRLPGFCIDNRDNLS